MPGPFGCGGYFIQRRCEDVVQIVYCVSLTIGRSASFPARWSATEPQRHNSMAETPISRGFKSRRAEQTRNDRLPPGQYVTTDFPILSAGPTPQIKVENWTLALQLGGSLLRKWSWAEFEALPQTSVKTDIHCVTKWSKLDTTWQGD